MKHKSRHWEHNHRQVKQLIRRFKVSFTIISLLRIEIERQRDRERRQVVVAAHFAANALNGARAEHAAVMISSRANKLALVVVGAVVVVDYGGRSGCCRCSGSCCCC